MAREEGILISVESLEEWAGRPLSRDDIIHVAEQIPESSIPEVIWQIAQRLKGE
jgi:hypothetical protein